MGLNDPFGKLKVTEVAGPDLRPTDKMTSPVKLERLLTEAIELARKGVTLGEENRDAIKTVAEGQLVMGVDIATLKAARATDEEQRRKHSGSIAAVRTDTAKTSQHNLEQDAAIATTLNKVASVEAKVDGLVTSMAANTAMTSKTMSAVVVEGARGFLKDNPKIETALAGFIIAALTIGTALLYSFAKGHGL